MDPTRHQRDEVTSGLMASDPPFCQRSTHRHYRMKNVVDTSAWLRERRLERYEQPLQEHETDPEVLLVHRGVQKIHPVGALVWL